MKKLFTTAANDSEELSAETTVRLRTRNTTEKTNDIAGMIKANMGFFLVLRKTFNPIRTTDAASIVAITAGLKSIMIILSGFRLDLVEIFVVGNELVVGHFAVLKADYPVGNGLNKLMVVRSKEYAPRKF